MIIAGASDLEHLRRKYKDRMLALAFIASEWSPAEPGQRHGCVLALDGKYVVSIGFNGRDRTALKFVCASATLLVPQFVHAEVNALLNTRQAGVMSDLSRCVAYVTKRPCRPCFEALTAAGISTIFWLQDAEGAGAYWHGGDFRAAGEASRAMRTTKKKRKSRS